MDLSTMNYIARYGLEFNPFLKNSKDISVSTGDYREILFRLDYLLNTKGFGLVTGSSGRGKTTAIRNWVRTLNPSLYEVVYSCLSTLTPHDFYRHLAEELGISPTHRKSENIMLIKNEIERLSLEKRKTPVIIIDEANHINGIILNELKMVFNFEMDSKDRAVMVLLGLPPLLNTLRLGIHAPLRQRIIMNYNLDGLSKEEGRMYINEKLKGAGCTRTIFEDAAIEAIINAADGTARLINKTCNSCLLIGDNAKCDLINAEIVMQAISDSELG